MIAGVRRLTGLLILLPAPALAQETAVASETGLSANLSLVSDYRFRGVSLSDRRPALQGGVEYSHKSGFFAGTWASSLGPSSDADLELDLYAGYSGNAAGLTYTVTALKYFYPGARGLSYVELQSKVEKEIGPATVEAEVAYTPPQDNAADSLDTSLGASFEGPREVTVFGRVGRENGAYSRKWDWELGLRRDFGPLSLSASYVATNHRAASIEVTDVGGFEMDVEAVDFALELSDAFGARAEIGSDHGAPGAGEGFADLGTETPDAAGDDGYAFAHGMKTWDCCAATYARGCVRSTHPMAPGGQL